MQILYGAIVLFFLGSGVYYLQDEPPHALHFLVIALYFFIILFEFRGNPFSRRTYVLLSLLLTGNAMIQFFLAENNAIYGLVSLFFAYFALQARRRVKH
ncbi:MAG: hypothetical protein M0Z65_01065 [Firmicutes bacterium]|uniref:Uncharacterized protein n=1 Tax=Melghirimyces thermohalophilus TaxID=1236220 RepID=A0A1G6I9U4_9BACL|nr:hypothetical protein [Melghirimyces thermohalophilus]MDA8351790.1 hypothetical protein [Bacillota bacterium]SDC03241.1 hypothetical protein SAMN04488112_102131 [Melghirimyces thermohalophilus]